MRVYERKLEQLGMRVLISLDELDISFVCTSDIIIITDVVMMVEKININIYHG